MSIPDDSPHSAASGAARVLVIDAEREVAETCRSILAVDGYSVTTCSRQQDSIDTIGRHAFDIAIIDTRCAGEGFEFIERVRARNSEALIIIATDDPSVDESLSAFAAGAWEYLPKPFSATHLQVLVGRAARLAKISRRNGAPPVRERKGRADEGDMALIGKSAAFQRLIALARKVAATDASVFITGESGTGKEVMAQLIHRESRRSGREMVSLNCAALPEQLLESEMFGHRKGAFTGAIRDKAGLLEIADGGTMFLDELTEMPQTIQAKLLRVIQDGVVRRVGSETPDATVNVRFIAATNRDAHEAMADGVLRKDLYYRLRVVPLPIPPLRERKEDVAPIASHFLTQYWMRHRHREDIVPELSRDAIHALQSWPWPGNVRELQNVIEHTVVLVDAKPTIDAEDIQFAHASGDHDGHPGDFSVADEVSFENVGYHSGREGVIARFERRYLEWLIQRASSNMSQAARLAGVDRTTLYRLMEKHNFKREVVRADA
jgi:DNA-binding NtrC family response regulator